MSCSEKTKTQNITKLFSKELNSFGKTRKYSIKCSSYTVDNIQIDEEDAYILRFYSKKEETMNKVPDFFNPIRDITKEKRYTTKHIALIDK